MINEMVSFSVILRRASKQIYHDSKGFSIYEKSEIALELDALLGIWRSSLPPWLNLDVKSLREPQWASKQKLVLQLSNTPFLNLVANLTEWQRVLKCAHPVAPTLSCQLSVS